jgi:hypothetical protein
VIANGFLRLDAAGVDQGRREAACGARSVAPGLLTPPELGPSRGLVRQ